ncbi:YbhB/YbcL family Raf kinase inhibitor-like protein [Ferruginibacter albus]|nr:YbhB/YbcL family Raf kinase inhibitor-like protein [Ferruginibacter albus]
MAIATASSTQLTVSSSAFKNGDYIPKKYTCEGDNVNPPITISNIPAGTKTFALIEEDPDATKGTFDHWVIWNISPAKTDIKENTAPGEEGLNGSGKKGYTGSCPPAGTGIHHYHFKVFALDKELSLESTTIKQELMGAMQGHIIEQAELIGLYQNTKL